MGCGLIIETEGDEAVYLEHKMDDPVSGGTLCAKGNYCLEMLNHPERLFVAKKKGAEVPLDAIMPEIASVLGSAPEKSAVIISGRASVEEIAAASSFARIFTAGNIAVNMPTGDYELFEALSSVGTKDAFAELDDINNASCILAVGDPFSVGPCIAKRFFASKYAGRGNTINVIAAEDGLIGKFAFAKIIGNEARALLGVIKAVLGSAKAKGELAPKLKGILSDKKIETDGAAAGRIAAKLADARSAAVVLASSSPVAAQLSAILVSLLENAKLYVLNDYGNARNIFEIFEQKKSVRDILGEIEGGRIETLLCLGADLVSSCPDVDVKKILSKLKNLVASAAFANRTTKLAAYVLPEAIWLEKEGTFTRGRQLPVLPPIGAAASYEEILKMIAEAGGKKLEISPLPGRQAGKALNEGDIPAIVEAAAKDDYRPAVKSSAKRFSDGSLTDKMSWYIATEERVL